MWGMSHPTSSGIGSKTLLYEAFGLTIASAVELPELKSGIGIADVTIGFGRIADAVGGRLEWKEGYQADERRLLIAIPAAGRFEIADGNRITIEPAEGVDQRRIRLLLLGTMFGALLMQRGILPIHGSAIAFGGRAVVLTGSSGAGKSSLLAAFRQHGAAFLTDDVAAISTDPTGTAWVHPAYPQQKLWRDSAQYLGIDVGDHARVLADYDKYAIAASAEFCSAPVPLGFVCELRPAPCPEVSIQTLSPRELTSTLIRHTFRRSLVRAMGRETIHLAQCIALSQKISGLRMIRPDDRFTLNEQVRQLKSQLDLGEAVNPSIGLFA